jgi:predicted ATPase
MNELFVERTFLRRDRIEREDVYPFSLAPVRALDGLRFAQVTYFIGENGSGKSTILEALAVAMGMNAEGGSQNMAFSTRSSESPLHRALRISRSYRRPQSRLFLRAESFFNVGTEIERLDEEPAEAPSIMGSYGGRSLHEQSHGESFLALITHRFGRDGLYILDEPEAALSPTRQLTLLSRMHALVEQGSQFITATHAPIVIAYPGATIYSVRNARHLGGCLRRYGACSSHPRLPQQSRTSPPSVERRCPHALYIRGFRTRRDVRVEPATDPRLAVACESNPARA